MTAPTLLIACLLWAGPLRANPIDEVRFDPPLGAQLPLDASLKDGSGRRVSFRQLLGDKPTILVFAYTRCPMLCPEVFNGIVRSLRSLRLRAGEDYHVISASFDPDESEARAAMDASRYSALLGGRQGAWTYVTGADAVMRLARAANFRPAYDAQIGQFAHAAGFLVLTPDGKISRSFYGVEYAPRDVQLSLMEASRGKIGDWTDHLLFYCYRYNPATGRYGVVIMRVLRLCAVATALALVILITCLSRTA